MTEPSPKDARGGNRGGLRPKRPMPEDFPETARGKSVSWAKIHWQTAQRTVKRWFREAGIEPVAQRVTRKSIPEDFAQVAPTLNSRELRQRYGINHRRLKEWLAETGASMRANPFARKQKIAHSKPSPYPYNYSGPYAVATHRDTSDEALAAEHLRCAKRVAIYRCRSTGAAHLKGDHWRYGAVVITRDELFDRAERAGWKRWAVAA